jgi:methionyl-tRNA synthetase
VDDLLYRCRFRESVRVVMGLAQEANRYLDEKAPWKVLKLDRDGAATSLYVALSVISCLKTLFAPFLPFTSEILHRLLGFDSSLRDAGWAIGRIAPGQQLASPQPLFTKLDEAVVAEEDARLGGSGAG